VQTFTIRLRCPWWVHALGRNPLVRRSDRVEAIAFVIAVIVAVVAIPVAGAIGTSVHDAHSRTHAEQMHMRHQVVATAVASGHLVTRVQDLTFTAEAAWADSGRVHRGVIPWSDWANVGDQQSIWVNDRGENVGPPSSPSRANGEAIGVALSVWVGLTEAAAAFVYLVRRWLNHARFAQWDRELDASHKNDNRRNHQS